MLDINQASRAVVEDWRLRRRPVVLLSEEPFWDTIWGARPLDRQIIVETEYGALPVLQLSHQTCPDLFAFEHIPYYVLTDHRFANAYAARFARNAARSAAAWRADFEARTVGISFMFERRPEPHHHRHWPEGDLTGLCAWRTELAIACPDEITERLGRSWHGGQRRQAAPDWHIDKLVILDGRARIIGALENTHQPLYLTEKLFDAFACGGLPLYYASPGHRLHQLDLPSESWINLFGLSPEEARDKVLSQDFSMTVFEAYRATQERLRALLTTDAHWQEERARLGAALPRALAQTLEAA
ncbi:hypothetical protein [Litorisediminicola beolgyonensis]|uniref:hypothetical protein n=1 Tax=Litorisediminicola beolgyonensis TaxID=1173614 RepID=UPI0036DF27B1